jgi:hypothetical protein
MKELPHQGMFASFRICPGCGKLFAPDSDTKIRQGLFIVVALVSLAFTLFLYFDSANWLVPAMSSYLALGFLVFWGNKKMNLVPYSKKMGSEKDT